MNLMPNLGKIFKENLDVVSNRVVSMGAPQPKEYAVVSYGKDRKETTLPIDRWEGDVAVCLDFDGSEIGIKPIRVVDKPFERGLLHPKCRDGQCKHPECAKKVGGIDEELSTDSATAPVPAPTPQNQQPQQPQQNPQEPQQNPKKMEEYQKKSAEFDKKIQMSIAEQQKLTKQKNDLDKKIQKFNLIQQKATQAKSDLAKKLGINQGA